MTAMPELHSPNTPNEMSILLKDTAGMSSPYIRCRAIISYSEYMIARERSPEYYFGIVTGWE